MMPPIRISPPQPSRIQKSGPRFLGGVVLVGADEEYAGAPAGAEEEGVGGPLGAPAEPTFVPQLPQKSLSTWAPQFVQKPMESSLLFTLEYTSVRCEKPPSKMLKTRLPCACLSPSHLFLRHD
jgi:hypothetical protein